VNEINCRGRRRCSPGRLVPVLVLVVAAATLAACSSTSSTGTTATTAPSAHGRGPIPAAAFHDATGVTSTSVTIGNISTETAGLFTGAVVGTRAYAAYVNSQGGINGRKIIVATYDDNFTGAGNKNATQTAVDNDFATVGGFSLEDSFGGTVLAANPDVPNVQLSLSASTSALVNTYSPDPLGKGWPTGPFLYFKSRFPDEIAHTGTLTSALPSALATWAIERSVMEHEGYKIVYQPSVPVTQSDFTQNVVAMRNAGVKLLYIDQLPQNYAAAVVKALNQQNFHPTLVIGVAAYSEALVPNSGGPAAIDGAYLEQPASLFLGEDAASLPAVHTFLTWVQHVSPGFTPDYYTLAGWASTELFADALKNAGADPTRGSELAALRKITTFSADHLVATVSPVNRTPPLCYVLARIVDGKFQRLDDPPTSAPAYGYRCDGSYYVPG
jgi:ABC-type branched-subunit amino acid transport system substrate-binding protein